MCGRYSLWDLEELDRTFPNISEDLRLSPHYNCAPAQFLPVITDKGMEMMRWGLIPRWAKDPSSQGYSLINARVESVKEKPMYKNLLKANRCLVPANGFFEWKHEGKDKIPQYIFVKKRKVITFAGLWDTWKDAEGKEFKSYTIITCEPNSFMAKIHNRMPVILDINKRKDWLSEKDKNYTQLLKPYPAKDMEAYPISSLVNRPANDMPQIIYKIGKV